jgi:hypothetical protein
MQIGTADIVILDIFLSGSQMVFPAVIGGLYLLHISLLNQIVDFIGGVWGRNPDKGCKFIYGGLLQRQNDFHTKGLHRSQTGLPVLKGGKYLPVKMELKLAVYVSEAVLQHRSPPLFSSI